MLNSSMHDANGDALLICIVMPDSGLVHNGQNMMTWRQTDLMREKLHAAVAVIAAAAVTPVFQSTT